MDRAMQERLVGASLLVLIAVLLIPWLLDGSTESVGQRSSERELILPGTPGSASETLTISLDAPNRGGSTNSAPSVETRSIKDVDSPTLATVVEPIKVPDREAGQASNLASDEAAQSNPVANAASTVTQPSIPNVQATLVEATPTNDGAARGETITNSTQPAATSQQTVAATTPASTDQPISTPPAATRAAAAVSPASDSKPPATFSTPNPNSQNAAGGAQGWAVQVGAFARQENAERLAERLRDKKYKAFVMRNVVEGRVRYRVRVGPVKGRADADLLAAALTEDRQPAKVLRHP